MLEKQIPIVVGIQLSTLPRSSWWYRHTLQACCRWLSCQYQVLHSHLVEASTKYCFPLVSENTVFDFPCYDFFHHPIMPRLISSLAWRRVPSMTPLHRFFHKSQHKRLKIEAIATVEIIVSPDSSSHSSLAIPANSSESKKLRRLLYSTNSS